MTGIWVVWILVTSYENPQYLFISFTPLLLSFLSFVGGLNNAWRHFSHPSWRGASPSCQSYSQLPAVVCSEPIPPRRKKTVKDWGWEWSGCLLRKLEKMRTPGPERKTFLEVLVMYIMNSDKIKFCLNYRDDKEFLLINLIWIGMHCSSSSWWGNMPLASLMLRTLKKN